MQERKGFSMEAWLVDVLFSPNRTIITEMRWMSQALLKVDTEDSGNLAEVTIFRCCYVQNRGKNILLSLASWLKDTVPSEHLAV